VPVFTEIVGRRLVEDGTILGVTGAIAKGFAATTVGTSGPR